MGEVPLDVAETLIQRPDRYIRGSAGEQFAHRGFRARIGTKNSCFCSEAARFAKIGDHWLLVRTLLGSTVQLGEGNDRRLELLGQQLQSTEKAETSCWRDSTRLPEDISWR